MNLLIIVRASLFPPFQTSLLHSSRPKCSNFLIGAFLTNSSIIHRASAIFVGVYEPTKQKLLKTIPENLSAFAHLVSLVTKQVSTCKLHIARLFLAKASLLI